jgi:hypothetical protein
MIKRRSREAKKELIEGENLINYLFFNIEFQTQGLALVRLAL